MMATIVLLLVSFSYGQTMKLKLTEMEKIENLILSIEKLDSAQFYRNGTYYTAQKAAEHLRMKVGKAGSRVKTAQDFIDKVASESYLSGEKYKIVYSDGRSVTSESFLSEKLRLLNVSQ